MTRQPSIERRQSCLSSFARAFSITRSVSNRTFLDTREFAERVSNRKRAHGRFPKARCSRGDTLGFCRRHLPTCLFRQSPRGPRGSLGQLAHRNCSYRPYGPAQLMGRYCHALVGGTADLDKRHGIRPEDLPKKANVLSGELKRIAPNLRTNGIEFRRAKSGSRIISLDKAGNSSSEPSEAPGKTISPDPGSDDARTLDTVTDDKSETELIFNPPKTVDLDSVDDPDDSFRRDSSSLPTEPIGAANGKPYARCNCGKHAFVGQQCPFCERENVWNEFDICLNILIVFRVAPSWIDLMITNSF